MCKPANFMLILAAQAVFLAVSVLQIVPLLWQLYLQFKSIMQKRSADNEY